MTEKIPVQNSQWTLFIIYKPVTANDVILAVAHFKSQARGDDGILHSIVAKALPLLAPYLAKAL